MAFFNVLICFSFFLLYNTIFLYIIVFTSYNTVTDLSLKLAQWPLLIDWPQVFKLMLMIYNYFCI